MKIILLEITFSFLSLKESHCGLKETVTEINNVYGDDENFQLPSGATKSHISDRITSVLNNLETEHCPGLILAAYVGSMTRIPCNQIATDRNNVKWMYTESIYNRTFRPMEEKEMAVDDGDLIIFYVRPPDAGVYQCQIGFAVSGLVILEVLDDEDPYTVVKPHSSRGPYSSPPKPITSELVVFSSWSVWSECSRCGVVGRRRRYGICYVGYGELNQNKNKDEASDSSSEDSVLLDDVGIKLFQAFPGGVPCGSQLLPKTIKKLPALGSRRNEIMIALCKIPCKSQVFELRSNKGEIIERTNNSEGVYSLRQKEPPQPPTVVQDIIFAAKGSRVIVKCPGTTLRNVPMAWRIGSIEVTPRELDKSSDGRIHLNARDNIVFTSVRYSDSNIYSCWQERNLAGVIKLKVFEDTRSKYGRRLMLVGLFVFLCVILRLIEKLYAYQMRRSTQ